MIPHLRDIWDKTSNYQDLREYSSRRSFYVAASVSVRWFTQVEIWTDV